MLPATAKSVGELEVRGPWVTAGYFGDDDPGRRSSATAGCAPATSARSRPDGYLTLTDRAKDVIKSGGEWISSVELENAPDGPPGVLEASRGRRARRALGRAPAGHRGAARGRDGRPSSELRDFLATRVARWQLPERWALIDAVPKTSVGKFDKKALRARYAAGELEVTSLA